MISRTKHSTISTPSKRIKKRRCSGKTLTLQTGLSDSITKKRVCNITQKVSTTTNNNICSLPNELIVEILAHVAASSISDFFMTKLSWKLFNKLAEDYSDYFYRQLSLDQLSSNLLDLHLSEGATSLFEKCLKNENPEALYREGVIEYISYHQRKECGLELLKRAATAGHLGASYVLGVILICKGDEFTQHGLDLLSKIKTSLQRKECREKLKRLADSIWFTQNEDFIKPKLFECQFRDRKRSAWTIFSDDGDVQSCEACKLNQDIIYACSILSGVNSVPSQMCYQD